MDWKNVLERAAWTFVEGFLVAIPFTGTQLDKSAIIAAVMAGLSAVKTVIVEAAQARLNTLDK